MKTAILTTNPSPKTRFRGSWFLIAAGCLAVAAAMFCQQIPAVGNPNRATPQTSTSSAILDISVLVFREGLECVLVLSAVMAGLRRDRSVSPNPIVVGAGAGFLATLLTWVATVRMLDDLSQSVSALTLQAATGLLAVIVLLIVMNWFFHKFYWTGWISLHTKRKQDLLESAGRARSSGLGCSCGMGLLGFTSLYREGFEVVLFLQSYRLRLGNQAVLWGACVGVFLSGIVALLAFVAHRKLPYRKMLVLTGIMLGTVLIVMVGEQAQEMQLAGWVSTTKIPALVHFFSPWMGAWLSLFPTAETLLAQLLAALLVIGSYIVANRKIGAKSAAQERDYSSAVGEKPSETTTLEFL